MATQGTSGRESLPPGRGRWLGIGHAAAATALLLAFLGFPSLAQTLVAPVTVLSLDEQGNQHIDLHLLEPLTPQLRAILAVYSFSAGTGCEADEDQPLRCALTTALALGDQCSRAQLELIQHWFEYGVPAFGGNPRKRADALRLYGYERQCYSAPSGASHQVSWDALQVEIAGDLVTVRARALWMNTTERAGDYRTTTVFRVLADRVEVVSDAMTDGDVVSEDGSSRASACTAKPVLAETGPGRERFLDWLRAHPQQAGIEVEPERAKLLIADIDNDDIEEYVLATPRGASGTVALALFRAVGTGWNRIEQPPFDPVIQPYVDPISAQAEPLVRFCGHVYVNQLGGGQSVGASPFPDTHVWEGLTWRRVCEAAWLTAERRAFQRLFDRRLYREAHGFLDGVAKACQEQAEPRAWLWWQSDLALTAYRMGSSAVCLEHVMAAEKSPAFARASPLLRRAVAANAALCRKAGR